MKLVFVVGTRPNFVKVSPLIQASRKHKIDFYLIHTGQHFSDRMSDIFFKELGIPAPDINLNINSEVPKNLKKETSEKIAPLLIEQAPDFVIVVGDSDATCAGAMAAKLAGLKLAHVEAGLRSFYMAMPEEVNRIYIDKVADILFVSERSGIKNLYDSKAKGKIFYVGNVMIDTLVQNSEKIIRIKPLLPKDSYAVATMHRKSNVDDSKDLVESIALLNYVADKFIKLVLPMHPRTKNNISGLKLKMSPNISILPPLGYLEFQNLLVNSKFVLTDSGGLQDETTFYRKPCVTLRKNTERPITYRIGTSVLVGRDRKKIDSNIRKIFDGKFKKGKIPKFWDGKTSERIMEVLIRGRIT